jgi:hypothetical protein
VRIQYPENLRIPPLGSSMEGESGPKARPKGVVDGKQVNIPVLLYVWYRRTEQVEVSRDLDLGGNFQGVER